MSADILEPRQRPQIEDARLDGKVEVDLLSKFCGLGAEGLLENDIESHWIHGTRGPELSHTEQSAQAGDAILLQFLGSIHDFCQMSQSQGLKFFFGWHGDGMAREIL